MNFVKNFGQFDPRIAWIANVTGDLTNRYHGEGLVTLTPGEKTGEFVDFSYVADVALYNPENDGYTYNGLALTCEEAESSALFEAVIPNVMTAMASCHQLLVEAGTRADKILGRRAARRAAEEDENELWRTPIS